MKSGSGRVGEGGGKTGGNCGNEEEREEGGGWGCPQEEIGLERWDAEHFITRCGCGHELCAIWGSPTARKAGVG